jgi:hypothetical protein
MAKGLINEPFMVINADDFYGKESFEVMAKFLCDVEGKQGKYCMAGYRVGNTLSEHGSVSRGVCSTDANGFLTDVVERTSIENKDGHVCYKGDNGEDVEIAKFNNWYFGEYGYTGFLFHTYYYQIDMAQYADAYCYFVVKDTATGNFGFVCLDDIVTYYAEAPDVSSMQPAGFCVRPVA